MVYEAKRTLFRYQPRYFSAVDYVETTMFTVQPIVKIVDETLQFSSETFLRKLVSVRIISEILNWAESLICKGMSVRIKNEVLNWNDGFFRKLTIVKIINEILNFLSFDAFLDDFNRPDSNDVGNNWIENEGYFTYITLYSGKVNIYGFDANIERPAGEAWKNGYIEVKTLLVQPNAEVAVIARYSATNTYWIIRYDKNNAYLKWFDGGSSGVADSITGLELSSSERLVIFTLNESIITANIQGVGTLTSGLGNTKAIAAGTQRFQAMDHTLLQICEFDDVVIYPLNMVGRVLAILGWVKIKNEVINFTESFIRKGTLIRIISEALNWVETVIRRGISKRVISETVNISETTSKETGFFKLVNETLNWTESKLKTFFLNLYKPQLKLLKDISQLKILKDMPQLKLIDKIKQLKWYR